MRYYKDRDFPEIKRSEQGEPPTIFAVSSETFQILPIIDELNRLESRIQELEEKLRVAREVVRGVKIVGVSNFDVDTVDDILVAENIQNKGFAQTICEAMNKIYSSDKSTYWFVVRPDEYQLHVWSP